MQIIKVISPNRIEVAFCENSVIGTSNGRLLDVIRRLPRVKSDCSVRSSS